MTKQQFRQGQSVKRAPLKPFEIDTLVPKIGQATGTVQRVWTEDFGGGHDGFYWMYEVVWKWPNGETSLAHYDNTRLEPA